MLRTSALLSGRSWVLRLLLVVALGVGLSAMHVLAGAVGQHHGQAHQSATTSMATMTDSMVGSAPEATAPAHGQMPVGTVGTVGAVGTAQAATIMVSDHDHHAMADCVLFLGAGLGLFVVLLAWVVARALRPSYWLTEAWPCKLTAITPWHGPPPWHWPRISLCVIRV